MGKFELYKDNSGEFRFRLKASNGQNILSSEGYTTKAACENGIASVQKNSGDANRYERKEAANGKFHFNLKASNGQVIGSSQMYASESGRDNGIESVMSNGSSSDIDDQS